MTLTEIDPTPALIVVDLQKGLMGAPVVHPLEEIVERSARLAESFRRHRLPVVLVRSTGTPPGRTDADRAPGLELTPPADWAELVDELEPQPDDRVIAKLRWGAFHDTSLSAHLAQLGVTQVVVSGIATSLGVESTARAAHDHGYHVVLAADAMTDLDPDAHANSLQRIFPRLGETSTTDEILELLDRSR